MGAFQVLDVNRVRDKCFTVGLEEKRWADINRIKVKNKTKQKPTTLEYLLLMYSKKPTRLCIEFHFC